MYNFSKNVQHQNENISQDKKKIQVAHTTHKKTLVMLHCVIQLSKKRKKQTQN